jgi:hypothetical protein
MSEKKGGKVGHPRLAQEEKAHRIELAKKIFGVIREQTGLPDFKLQSLLELDHSEISNSISGRRPLTYVKAIRVMRAYLRVSKESNEVAAATAEIPVRAAMEKLREEMRVQFLTSSEQLDELRDEQIRVLRADYALRKAQLEKDLYNRIVRLEKLVQFGTFATKPARFPK